MSDNPNKTLISNIYDEINRGNSSLLIQHLHDDIVWTVIGSTQYSGEFFGKQNVIENLVSQVESSLTDPSAMTVKNIIAEGDYVVVEATGKATTVAGKPYENKYCEVYKIREGKIITVTVYLDTEAIAKAF